MASVSAVNLAYYLLIDLVAVVAMGFALIRWDVSWSQVATVALLVVLALGFEEGASRSARLQLRLSSDLKRDMGSVWAITGAVALAPGATVVLLTCVLVYVWLRQQRPAGETLYRKVFNASITIICALTAGSCLHFLARDWPDLPWALASSVSVVAAIVVYTLVNRVIVTVALVGLGARGRALIGSRDDNLIELATLCLGGLVSLAVAYQPLLAVLVIPPMVTLQRGALVRELETAATTDAKTGLLNATAWEHLAQRELGRSQRDSSSLGILIIDIDRFKLVNDRYGHLAGDLVLRGVAKAIAASLREYDTVGRFGGEEFVAVLPDADDVTALAAAERLRARINNLRISDLVDTGLDGHDERLAVSVGVACSPAAGYEVSDLLYAADQALYQAKAMGRNRVQLARRGGELPGFVAAG